MMRAMVNVAVSFAAFLAAADGTRTGSVGALHAHV
jgi:hypothetical protein